MEKNSPSLPQGQNLEIVQPLPVKKTDSEAGGSAGSLQLTFRLVPDDKPTVGKWLADTGRGLWRDAWARYLTIFIFVALLALVLQRILFFHISGCECTVGPFTVFAQYPEWVAPRDEETLSMTLFNNGDADLTQVRIRLVFTDTLCLLTDTRGSTIIEFGDLAAGERKTRTAHFRLEKMAQGCPMQVQAQLISAERGAESIPSVYTIRVISIPTYKTSVQRACGASLGVLGIILGFFLERFSSAAGIGKK